MKLKHYDGNIWVLATAPATLWAAIEIVLGSFLHNLRIPFAGSILTFFSIGLMSGLLQIWPYKGLLWRVGLITALLKSVSPSHIILGPMIGILSESVLMEISVRVLGGGFTGLAAGGMLAMNASLLHKILNLLILYGWNIAVILLNIFRWLTRQTGWENADPALVLIIVPSLYAAGGTIAAWIGFRAGKSALKVPLEPLHGKSQTLTPSEYFEIPQTLRPIPGLIAIHLVSFISILILLGINKLIFGWILTIVYFIFTGIRYKEYLKRFKKPALWLQFIAILAMALIFGTNLTGSITDLGDNLVAGINMIIRAALLITSLSCIMAELHSPVVRILLDRSRMKHLIHALELAAGGIPWILSQLPHPSQAFRHPRKTLTLVLQLSYHLNNEKTLTEIEADKN
jgi:hypothetical protein